MISSENNIEKTNNETVMDTTTIDENIINIGSAASSSSDSDVVLIDTSINSTSDGGQLESTTPTTKKHTSKPKLKKLESAKKQEEKLRLKQVSYLSIFLSIFTYRYFFQFLTYVKLIFSQEKEKAREEKLKEQAEKQRLKQLEKEQKKNAEIEYE